jgi:hypothetical protein
MLRGQATQITEAHVVLYAEGIQIISLVPSSATHTHATFLRPGFD